MRGREREVVSFQVPRTADSVVECGGNRVTELMVNEKTEISPRI